MQHCFSLLTWRMTSDDIYKSKNIKNRTFGTKVWLGPILLGWQYWALIIAMCFLNDPSKFAIIWYWGKTTPKASITPCERKWNYNSKFKNSTISTAWMCTSLVTKLTQPLLVGQDVLPKCVHYNQKSSVQDMHSSSISTAWWRGHVRNPPKTWRF